MRASTRNKKAPSLRQATAKDTRAFFDRQVAYTYLQSLDGIAFCSVHNELFVNALTKRL